MTDITNTIETLRAVVVATWSFLSPTAGNAPDAEPIADAIATAVAGDADPLYGSANVEAAVMAQWAWHESRLSTHPKAVSWDAHAGVSCGAFQQRARRCPPRCWARLWPGWPWRTKGPVPAQRALSRRCRACVVEWHGAWRTGGGARGRGLA